MKKKIVSVLLVAAMAVSMFTGCGSKSDSKKSDSKSGEKTLEVWVPPLDDATEKNWGDLLKDWEKENDCKVNLTVIPWDKYEETYTTALNSGEGPDVGYMYNEMFPTYIDAGAVEDMSSYVTDEDKKEYKYLSNGNMMDGQYGWPLVTGVPFVLYYNEDILNARGEKAPETWDDFARICQEATKDTDGDGIREINGKKISLRYITYESRRLSDFAQAIQTQLKDIGIDVKIDSMDADREWNLMVAGEYDLCDSNWITVGNGDPTEYMANWYGKSDANFCNYKNDEYDKLYEQLDTEFDETKRAEIIERLQQILIDDAAVVVHGYYNSSMISDKTVTGADIHTADYYWLTTDIAPAK